MRLSRADFSFGVQGFFQDRICFSRHHGAFGGLELIGALFSADRTSSSSAVGLCRLWDRRILPGHRHDPGDGGFDVGGWPKTRSSELYLRRSSGEAFLRFTTFTAGEKCSALA